MRPASCSGSSEWIRPLPAVPVTHTPRDHVCDCLETAMRMIGKAAYVIAGIIAGETVQHQVGIETALQILRQHTGQAHTVAIGCRHACYLTLDSALAPYMLRRQRG
jgi:hypothetical protein